MKGGYLRLIMKNRNSHITAGLSAAQTVLSALLAAGVRTVFRVCGPAEDGTYMHCREAEQAVFLLGLALTVLSLIVLACAAAKKSAVRQVLSAFMILLSAAAALIPGRVISLCMMPGMRCRSIFRPSVTVLAVLIALLSTANAARKES